MQHRVVEIRAILPNDCWRHCPGTENPVDLPSRGLTPMELALSGLWASGPKWLGEKSTDSPPPEISMPEGCTTELRVKDQPQTINFLATSENAPDLSAAIDCRKYSSIQKLLKVTAHVVRFVDKLNIHVSIGEEISRAEVYTMDQGDSEGTDWGQQLEGLEGATWPIRG